MEGVYEKCVVKPRSAADNIITFVTVLATIGIIAFSIIWAPLRTYAIAIGIVAVFIAYRLITDRNIEFEYTLAGNSIALDKIINKRKRKRVMNCDLTDFDIVAPLDSHYYEEHRNNYAKKIISTSGDHPGDEYFGILEYDGKRTMLVIETDGIAIRHLKKYMDQKLKG